MKPLALALFAAATAPALAVNIGSGYSQNFNSLGSSGTTLTAGGTPDWSTWRIRLDSTWNGPTWTDSTGIPAADLVNGILVDDTLNVSPNNQPLGLFYNASFPTFTRRGGINAGHSTDPNDIDRALGTSGTGVAGMALQVSLTNDTAAAMPTLAISYDTTVLSIAAQQGGPDELLGYRFFYSLTGPTGTWISAAALDTVTSIMDAAFTNYTTAATISLASSLAPGQSILLRWVDDNAQQSSPDQMIAIDNVSVVPAPGAAALLGLGGLLISRRRRA